MTIIFKGKDLLIAEASRLFANWQKRKGFVQDEVSSELSTVQTFVNISTITLRNVNGVLAVYSYNGETDRYGRRDLMGCYHLMRR